MVVQQVVPGVVKANASKSYRVIDDIVTVLASGEDTGGAYAMFEVHSPAGGGGVPPDFDRIMAACTNHGIEILPPPAG